MQRKISGERPIGSSWTVSSRVACFLAPVVGDSGRADFWDLLYHSFGQGNKSTPR